MVVPQFRQAGGRAISTVELLAVALLIAVGLVGVIVPVLPGLLLVWAAGVWWTIADGGGAARWAVLAVMTGLFVVGVLAKYILPGRATSAAGAPLSTMLIGAVCAVIGFFVLPVVGLLVGGIAGIYLAELARLGNPRLAFGSTRAALVAFGIGLLVELGAGVAMAGTWALGELVT
jgi:uncharacterized protein YqgC (DUF456 family)